jgi:hypothetical protein
MEKRIQGDLYMIPQVWGAITRIAGFVLGEKASGEKALDLLRAVSTQAGKQLKKELAKRGMKVPTKKEIQRRIASQIFRKTKVLPGQVIKKLGKEEGLTEALNIAKDIKKLDNAVGELKERVKRQSVGETKTNILNFLNNIKDNIEAGSIYKAYEYIDNLWPEDREEEIYLSQKSGNYVVFRENRLFIRDTKTDQRIESINGDTRFISKDEYEDGVNADIGDLIGTLQTLATKK